MGMSRWVKGKAAFRDSDSMGFRRARGEKIRKPFGSKSPCRFDRPIIYLVARGVLFEQRLRKDPWDLNRVMPAWESDAN